MAFELESYPPFPPDPSSDGALCRDSFTLATLRGCLVRVRFCPRTRASITSSRVWSCPPETHSTTQFVVRQNEDEADTPQARESDGRRREELSDRIEVVIECRF